MNLIKEYVPHIYLIVSSLRINPIAFAVKRFNLLLTQNYQFLVPVIIEDSLVAHFEELMEFVTCLGISHLDLIRERISKGNFADTLVGLQNVKAENVLEVSKRVDTIF
jgi:hypothetical protein